MRRGQRRARPLDASDRSERHADTAAGHRALGDGHPLDPALRAGFEPWLGADLGTVRLHTDAAAERTAASLNASAFTFGQGVAFGRGAYRPQSSDGRRLLAHELAHVLQGDGAGAAPSRDVSHRGDAAELEADRVADAFARGDRAPPLEAIPTARIARQEDDPDHPPSSPLPGSDPDVTLEPLAEWTPVIDEDDPATFWTPPGTTREQVAQRLYGDTNHFGGFDVVGDRQVRLRSFTGVAADVVTAMRDIFDKRLPRDVDAVVGILVQRRIDGGEEWQLLNTTEWWASRGDLTNAANRSYFDAYLDRLDAIQLEEWGLFSDTTRPATEWLLVEAEEKQWAIYPLIGRRSSRPGPVQHHRTGEMSGFTRVTGPITHAPRPWNEAPRVVGTFTYWAGEDRFLISSRGRGIESIQVGEMIVAAVTASSAEIALRNWPKGGPRVMIPGGDGFFYGYTIVYPHFWDEGYVQSSRASDASLERFWWHYPGTVFIPGGGFQPEFAKGGERERTQRTDILNRALAAGLPSLRGLDFDVLSMLTFDQRVTVLSLAAGSPNAADLSLIARVLHSTPSAEFATLEHRISANGTMERLLNTPQSGGGVAIVGRVFTVKSLEAMQVPGETVQELPEFKVGFDEDGFYHYAYPKPFTAGSRLLSGGEFPTGAAVAIGRERAAAGETAGPVTRTVTYLQAAVFRHGGSGVTGFAKNLVRGMRETLVVDEGPQLGPYLPTQLVKVTSLGASPETRIVTVVEAVGMLELPAKDMLGRMLATHLQGGLWVVAGLGLARAFGPAFAEGLTSGAGVRGIATGLAEAAGTQAGRAALVNTALVGSMELVDRYRAELQRTPEGRAFLELYDVTMMVWVSHDVARLITSGLVPRLAAVADRLIALPGVLREAVLPLRVEVEALRRAISRFSTPAEAAQAAVADAAAAAQGVAMGVARPARPGFFAMLRITRGEVAAERLIGRLAGTPAEAAGKRVLDRLGSLASRSQREAAAAAAEKTVEAAEASAVASRRAQSAADAQFAVAQRAAQLRPAAREAFLKAVDTVVATRPHSLGSLTDLLVAAAQSRTPNAFLVEVQALVSRPGVSEEALLVLGRKVREGRLVLDLPWLNRTSITDEALDFLGRDKRTNWDLYRRAAADPRAADVMKSFRTSARGAGAEMVGETAAEKLGTNVRRQVKMGSSEIDFDMIVAGRRHGFEVKGWTRETWDEALDAAIRRLNRKGLSDVEKEAVKKIDRMIGQLQDAQAATGRRPFLGFTDALPKSVRDRLRRLLEANGLGSTRFVSLSEAEIKQAAAGTIGEALGIPRP